MIVARPESKANERPRVGYGFRLPAMIRLIAAHGIFAVLIPCTRRLARHVVFADERFLDRLRPLRVYLLLPADGRFLLFFGELTCLILLLCAATAGFDFTCLSAAECGAR